MGFLSTLFGDPPQPPNPIRPRGRRPRPTSARRSPASYLNNYNQVTPHGNLTYDVDRQLHLHRPAHRAGLQRPALDRDADPDPDRAGDHGRERSAPALSLAQTGEASANRIGGILGTNFADTVAGAPGRADRSSSLDTGDLRSTASTTSAA